MKLLVGLGNVGVKYSKTRHNVGFMYLDYFANKSNLGKFENKNNLHSLIIKSSNFILAKPTTMMNNSGEAVKKILDFYNIPVDNLVLIHDDLDIQIGEYKLQKGKGPKDHNGILSTESHLGTVDFLRIRIGIENRSAENRISGELYVLSDFTNEEQEILQKVFSDISSDLLNL